MPLATYRSCFIVLAIAFALAPRGSTAQTKPSPTTKPTAPLRVLFIGDGYTAANGGLDQVVQVLAKGKGRTIECVASTSFGKSLAWHWESGAARALIAKGGWDFVVLQGPSPRNVVEREQLIQTLRLFDGAIDKVRAKPILLATWGSAMATDAERAETEPIERLAEELEVKLAPVGVAEERAGEEKPGLKLRAGDKGLPSPAGTYLAACVLYASLADDSSQGLSPSVKTAGRSFVLTAGDAEILQRVANAAVGVAAASAADAKAATAPAKRRVVYVLDATGTMLGLKFRLVQAQTALLLSQLGPDDRFNIIAFRGGDTVAEWTHPFSSKLEIANEANTRRAQDFVASHNVFPKGTNPIPALRLAFRHKPDVIYFLSDGEFNNIVGYEQVRQEVQRLNAAMHIPINTVGFHNDGDAKAESVLANIALDSGGQFTKVTDKVLQPATAPATP